MANTERDITPIVIAIIIIAILGGVVVVTVVLTQNQAGGSSSQQQSFCGDGVCIPSAQESCSSCPIDCGECPTTSDSQPFNPRFPELEGRGSRSSGGGSESPVNLTPPNLTFPEGEHINLLREQYGCKNSEYSTVYSPFPEDPHSLDPESESILRGRIQSEGDSALQGISDLTCLTSLNLIAAPVSDISALAGLTNMTWLELMLTEVSDLSPLSNMKKLEYLNLMMTPVEDVSPLSGLTNLTDLVLDFTKVSDITPLIGLKNLAYLGLHTTQVEDIMPLKSLTNLGHLELKNVPDEGSCPELQSVLPDTYIFC
jgi:hypothetical protein